ncbi:UNVERIFIED_CONTAM: Histone acetyltransferase HAC1 [Sesamum calycinum]|uniref:Histone acetyltransferase HAC1 n=1 Tax=Sesamum calycinum TaxID=2727403 RepID=A0AAW2J353_9LAMI
MNLQKHHPGQISGQVSNQAGAMLPGLPHQNGNPVSGQMQNPSVPRNVQSMDPEIVKTRRYMQEKIWEFLMQRRQQSHEVSTKKMIDLVKRLEEGLFKSATTKACYFFILFFHEEYLNLATLESRLHILIKRFPTSNHNQQFSHANSFPPAGTMIPTPGFQQTGNSSMVGTSSVDSSLVATNSSSSVAQSTVNSGNFLPTRNGSSGSVHGGALAGGYQQSSPAFSVNTGGTNTMTSTGVHRITSQMIPTPGVNNSNNNDINSNASNDTLMNMESSNSVGQKSFGLSSGPLTGGLGMTGKNISAMNPGTTEGHLTGNIYGNSTKSLHQHFDQHQQPVMQGDGYGICAADASGSRNLYVPVNSVGSMMNNQSLNTVSMPSMPKTTNMQPQAIDQPERMNFQSQYLVKENLVQSHQHQQFQQPSHQFQHRQLAQHQFQQKMQMQNQLLLKNNSFSQSQPSSNIVSEAKSGMGTEHSDDGLQSESSKPFLVSDMQNQLQQNSMNDHSRTTQPSGPLDVCSSLAQASEQMQQSLNPANCC